MERAAKMFHAADEKADDDDDNKLREDVAEHAAAEKDPYRKARMLEQARRQWGSSFPD